jgi:phospholipase/carboxylesterase
VSVKATPDPPEKEGYPIRRGDRPQTSDAPDGTRVAHEQKTQNAPAELQEALLDRVKTLPGIRIGRSYVSVPGARAFHLDPELARGPREAFAARQEFGHLHPPHDGSLHLNPEPKLRRELIEKGWAEAHPRSSRTVMLYGPRDEAELEVAWSIVKQCYDRAAGIDR